MVVPAVLTLSALVAALRRMFRFYPYSTLIRYAIKGSPNQKLLLEDIYYAIESRVSGVRVFERGTR